MNGTFRITSSTNNSQFEYKNSAMIIQGNFAKDATSGVLQNIAGSCYRMNAQGQQGEYFGNFNGYLREGSQDIKYSMSEMSRRDANYVWDAIDEIEPYVLGTDNNTEE